MQISYLTHKHSNIVHPFLSGISLNATLATKCRFIACDMAFTNKPMITLEFVANIQLLNANKYFFSDSQIFISVIKISRERRKLFGSILPVLHEKKTNKCSIYEH